MRSLITPILVFCSFTALACPELSGQYTKCLDPQGDVTGTQMTISQKIENRATVYLITAPDDESGDMTTTSYRADGRTYIQSENHPDLGSIKTSTTVSCNGRNSLRMRLVVSIQGQNVTDIITELSKSAGKLTQVTKGTAFGEDIHQTEICQ